MNDKTNGVNGSKVTLPEDKPENQEKSVRRVMNDKNISLTEMANLIHEMNLLQWRGFLRDLNKPTSQNLSKEESGRLVEIGDRLASDKRYTTNIKYRQTLLATVGSFPPGDFLKRDLPDVFLECRSGIDAVLAIQSLAREDEVDLDLLEFKRLFLTEVSSLISNALGSELKKRISAPTVLDTDGTINLHYLKYATTKFKYSYMRIPETDSLTCNVTFEGFPLIADFWQPMPGLKSDISLSVRQAQENAKNVALQKLSTILAFNLHFGIEQGSLGKGNHE